MKCIQCLKSCVSFSRNNTEKRIFLLIITLCSLLCTVLSELPRYRTQITCEGTTMNIECDPLTHINLIRANFGRFSIQICNDHGNLEWRVDCITSRSFRMVQEICAAKQNCTIAATTSFFGDACPATRKYLEVQYQCLPDSPKKKTQGSTGAAKPLTPPPIIIPPKHRPNHETQYRNNDSAVDIVTSDKQREKSNGYVVTDDESSSVSPSTTRSSTTKHSYESISEPTDIYIRHPHPRLPTDTNSEDAKSNNSSNKNEPKGSTLVVVVNPLQSSTTKLVSGKTDAIYTRSPSFTTSMIIDAASHCSPSQARNLTWDWTPVGKNATQKCPSGSTGTAKWSCTFDAATSLPVWVPEDANLSNCTSNWVATLEKTMNKEDLPVAKIAQKLAGMTKSNTFYGEDISRVAEIFNQLVERMEAVLEDFTDYRSRNQFVKDILDSIQESCNNLFEERHKKSWMDLPSKQRNKVATELIGSLERTSMLFSESNIANSDYSRVTNNIYMAVHTRMSKETNDGIELPIVNPSNAAEVNKTTGNGDYLLYSNKVYLPLRTLKKFEKDSVIRMTLLVYSKLDALFSPNKDSTEPGVISDENVTTIMNSNIVGLLLNKEGGPLLDSKVRLTFKHLVTTNVTAPKCVYWKVPQMKWSSGGCDVIQWNHSHTTCECDHLTNFAVLMQLRDIPMSAAHETAFRIITFVGCIVSVVCLILTLAIFALCRNLKGDRIAIHTNLCVCLLIGELVFLFGIGQTETIILCRAVALVLHYIFLSAFMWMFFEGFQLYVMLIEVFESERSRLRYYYFFAYGIPLKIVLICAYLDPYSYGTEKYCWLRNDNYFIFSFVGPVVAILMANIVFLMIALCVMWKHISSVSAVAKPNKDENRIRSIRLWLRGALALVFLLGITWLFGLLYLNQQTIVMAYLFTIFNSFQGMFIFIFHCLQNEKVRKEYSKLMNSLQSKANCFSSSGDNNCSMSSAEKRKSPIHSDATSISNPHNSSQTQEPIIAPNSGSALTPTLRRVTTPAGAKYFITGKVDGVIPENEYGFRRIEEMRNRQKQRCRGHCDNALRNPLVEHVYECIDDNPYTAKFASSACSCRQDFNFRSQTESPGEREDRLHLEENPNAFQEIKLPAIICDNSTVISKSNCKTVASPKHRQKHREDEKRNMVAKLNGRQVVTSAVCNTLPDTKA